MKPTRQTRAFGDKPCLKCNGSHKGEVHIHLHEIPKDIREANRSSAYSYVI